MLVVSALTLVITDCAGSGQASRSETPVTSAANFPAEASPVYGIMLPSSYRDWPMISVARAGGNVDDLRVRLGNDVAIEAYRKNTRPFPDGTIIAQLAYHASAPAGDDAPVNVQVMVKDSRRYASTGGWGFAQFTDGKPDAEAVQRTCFGCHEPAKDRDFVFTRYSP
jgi:hypothetical protein